MSMNDVHSLSHTKWNYKHHIEKRVFGQRALDTTPTQENLHRWWVAILRN